MHVQLRILGLIEHFPDKRTGRNTVYRIEDAVLGAFSAFFTQNPYLPAHQATMTKAKGKGNTQTLFGMRSIPSDNHIRDLLDAVPPQQVFPMFGWVFTALNELGQLLAFRGVEGQLLIVLDGT